jgi:hypothetical protein
MRTAIKTSLVLALAALPLAGSGCSFLGLDKLPQTECSYDAMHHSICDDLGTISPTADTCHTWQCNTQTHHCEVMLRDDDHDGAPNMMCASSGADCDDAANWNHPGGTETCDGRDNDCNGVPDDGVLLMGAGTTTATINGGTEQQLVGGQIDSDDAAVFDRYSSPFSIGRVLVSSSGPMATPQSLSLPTMSTTLPVNGSLPLATAGVGGSRYAAVVGVSTVPMSSGMTCQQWAVLPSATTSTSLSVGTMDHAFLPACPASGPQFLSLPAVAGVATEPLLVGWLAGRTDPMSPRMCGAAMALPVSLGGARFGMTAITTATTTTTLGSSVDITPPALLRVGASAFLVAYPLMDHSIEIRRVTITPTLDVTDGGVVYTEAAGASARQQVRLALGPTDMASGHTTVALSFVDGCDVASNIVVRWLDLSGSTLTSAGATASTGTGNGRSAVEASWQARSSQWLVTWSTGLNLMGQRFGTDRAAIGDAFMIGASSTSAHVQPLAAGPLWMATLPASNSIGVVTFGCQAPAM